MKYLIDEAGNWWRMWSVRLAAFVGLLTAYLAANPSDTEKLLALLPDGPLRTLAAVGVGLLVFATATGARLVKQKPKDTE